MGSFKNQHHEKILNDNFKLRNQFQALKNIYTENRRSDYRLKSCPQIQNSNKLSMANTKLNLD